MCIHFLFCHECIEVHNYKIFKNHPKDAQLIYFMCLRSLKRKSHLIMDKNVIYFMYLRSLKGKSHFYKKTIKTVLSVKI